VTFAVTPDQVDILVAARAKGSLSLSLRGVNDHVVVNRPKPKPPVAETHDKRWEQEQEKRRALERELRELKEMLAKKAAEPPPPPAMPPPPPPRPKPRYVTVYRGPDQVQRVRIDVAAVTELALQPEVAPRTAAPEPLDRFGSGPSREPESGDPTDR
jgi:pilus assembly protein CpaB